MKVVLTVVVGEDQDTFDQTRQGLFGDVSPERFDLADDDVNEVLLAVSSPSMFGDVRHVLIDNADIIDKSLVSRFVDASEHAVVVARAVKLPKAVTDELKKTGATVVTAAAAKGAVAARRVNDIAAEHGVTLPAEMVPVLLDRADGDLMRVRHVIEGLASVGLHRPKPAQVLLLAGSGEMTSPPWELGAAIESGNPVRAVKLLNDGEHNMFAVLAWLRNRVIAAGLVADGEEPAAGRKGQDARRAAQLGTRVLLTRARALMSAEIALKSAGADMTGIVTDLTLAYSH